MTFFKKLRQDSMYTGGLIAVAVSFAVAFLPPALSSKGSQGVFILNFGIALLYLLFLLFSGRLRRGRNGLPPLFLFLVMSLISAYTLNREIQIFHVSTDWLSALLVISSINYIAVFWYDEMPRWLKFLHVSVICISLVLFGYLAVYLIPQYGFGIVFCWALLLPMHSFVPLLLVIYSIVWLRRISANSFPLLLIIWSSIGLTVVAVMVYVIAWCMQVHTINRHFLEADRDVDRSLPVWVRVAAKIPANWLTERILKTDSRFGTIGPITANENPLWNIPMIRRSNEFRHDPLIAIATALGHRLDMPVEDRQKMLQAVFNERHQAEERLWSGEDLFTEEVNSKIRIWPQYRIAYTDITIKVRCGYNEARWTSEEEAIYSFYLPEGSTVTALSLWIDGKESPGILTTKSKADTAYNTIVGRESRDPSVLHWQEGNRVSVRVFPVMPGDYRQFRVGVTSPLQIKKGRMEYQSIDIEGPSYSGAKGPVFVEMMGPAAELEMPSGFTDLRNQNFERLGSYDAEWAISMQPVIPDPNGFHFNGHTYSVRSYALERAPFQPGAIYLDVNKAWTKNEFEAALNLPGNAPVFVCIDEKLVRVTDNNKTNLFKTLHQQQFSLFPVHVISEADTALLITKGPEHSPNLHELKETEFLASLKTFVTPGPRLRMFCIDGKLSPYLRTLKEYRVFQYDQGTIDDCNLLLARKEFTKDAENENQIVIDHSNLMITRTDDSVKSNAPDHLMRLFAYNHVMQQAGAGLLNGEEPADPLVEVAAEANVVTPVSSLVVLESKADYERFDIKASENSLHNAALGSKGAVPEPHEWALIILAVLILFTLKFRPIWKRKLS